MGATVAMHQVAASCAHHSDRLFIHPQGCVLIFLSGFLAMMIKMDVADEANRSVFGVCLVTLNVALIIAVSWFVMRHIKDASDEDETNDA